MRPHQLQQQVQAAGKAVQPQDKLTRPVGAFGAGFCLRLRRGRLVDEHRHVIGRRSSRNTSRGQRSRNAAIAGSGADPSVKNP